MERKVGVNPHMYAGYGTKQCPSGHAVSIYAQAVEQDRLFAQEMMKTMTPEQINRFCFENGYSVPEPKEKGQWVGLSIRSNN